MENQLITLLRISTPQLGSYVKDKLEEHNIEVFFTNEGLSPGDQYNPKDVVLKVKARDSEKAIARLLEIHNDFDLYKVKENESFVTFKRILVPVKPDENGLAICEYAMGLAKRQHAEIKILYVYTDPRFNEPERHTTSWEKYVRIEQEEAHQKAQLKLTDFSKELRAHVPPELFNSVRVHYRMLKGTPEHVITEAGKRYQPDLVIMGTSTTPKEDGNFMGKTLINVIEQTRFPILTVPVGTRFKGKENINVMYATDFYDSDNSSLNKLLEILKPYNKTIHCVHIALRDDPLHQEKVNELNKMLAKEYSEHQIECILFEGETILQGLLDFVDKNDIDIISISKKKHSALYKIFHSDLPSKLVVKVDVPILVFPV